jgi:hypothetical protein
MERKPLKKLSLDTNLLFDLADQKDFAHDFRETYQGKGYSLVISPTVVAELFFLSEHGDSEEKRLAAAALAGVGNWDIQPFPLTGVQLDLARHFATVLIERNLLPDSEINDAFILAESAVGAIPLVVSSDHHLLAIDHDKLRDACAETDLHPTLPVSPRRLLRALR